MSDSVIKPCTPGLIAGAAPRIRIVEITSGGVWRVRTPGAQRASAVLETRAEAEARAREILRKCGGGELHVRDAEGETSYTVAAETAMPGRRKLTRQPRN